MNSEQAVDFYYDSRPKVTFEMDQDTLCSIKSMRDGNGAYLYTEEPNHPSMPGRFLGVPIVLATLPGRFLQLRYDFKNGHSVVIPYDEVGE